MMALTHRHRAERPPPGRMPTVSAHGARMASNATQPCATRKPPLTRVMRMTQMTTAIATNRALKAVSGEAFWALGLKSLVWQVSLNLFAASWIWFW